jgi:isoleucyl-tRNA synthetase
MRVFLPKTEFNLHTNNKEVESKILEFWDSINLEAKRSSKRNGAQKFVLHDGPPYANGPLHIGHTENKFWKDAINKIFWQSGYDTVYIPGWDSHGLPIETAVEKELKAEGIDKNTMPRQEFWDRCYSFSDKWMKFQKQQFKNFGVFADYEKSYATFFEPESIGIMECAHKFVEGNMIEQRYKPVLWSYAEKTALAYAEVEYKDKISNSIYIYFPIIKTEIAELEGASLVVWTTTPWTLSANEAVAYNKEFEYVIFESLGKKYSVLKELFDIIASDFEGAKIIHTYSGSQLEGTLADHPLTAFRYRVRPLLHANHVDKEKGTGFVHTAPAHGEEDFTVGVANGLNIEDLLDRNGLFKEDVPLVGGKNIKEAEVLILEALKNEEMLLKSEQITHSYPHSWRSKAPLIFRLTKQWFMKIDEIKAKALKAIENPELGWVPKEGKNRLVAMVGAREDWCISRQRVWGVPIGIFFKEETGEILSNSEFLEKTRAKLAEVGVKNWWNLEVEDIDANYSSSEWKRLDDIIEIWFESGSTQYFILQKYDLFPCDVYLEGSDQHRGWFQSSLLISAFLKGCAPWKNLITHGFCLDGSKQKMSKSVGNVIDPAAWSADNLRLFYSLLNLCSDVSVNEQSIKNSEEMMFRFRNTIRFMLGIQAIEENPKTAFQKGEENRDQLMEADYAEMPLLEKWVLHRLTELEEEYKEILKTFQFGSFMVSLYDFCSQDLSAFYFDIRKDALYCEAQDNPKRASAVQCMQIVTETLLKWMSIVMPFFAEEAWQIYLKENGKISKNLSESIHLEDAANLPIYFASENVKTQMDQIRALRKQITEKTEGLREQKLVTTSAETKVILTKEMLAQIQASLIEISQEKLLEMLKEIAIVSKIEIGTSFEIFKMEGAKCPRCRFVYEELASEHCNRCTKILFA